MVSNIKVTALYTKKQAEGLIDQCSGLLWQVAANSNICWKGIKWFCGVLFLVGRSLKTQLIRRRRECGSPFPNWTIPVNAHMIDRSIDRWSNAIECGRRRRFSAGIREPSDSASTQPWIRKVGHGERGRPFATLPKASPYRTKPSFRESLGGSRGSWPRGRPLCPEPESRSIAGLTPCRSAGMQSAIRMTRRLVITVAVVPRGRLV